MKIGSYEFAELTRNNVRNLPEGSGLILMQDKVTGLYDVAAANNLRRRAEAALHGDVTPNIQRLHPVSPETNVKFLYTHLGYTVRPVMHRCRVKTLLHGKMIQRSTRGTHGQGYTVNLFTYPESSEYVISIQTVASTEDPLTRLYRHLNGKIRQTHETSNPIIRNFCKKRGPFDAKNSFILEQHQTNIETLKEAKAIAAALALKLGTEYLLTANVVAKSQWKHPGWGKEKTACSSTFLASRCG